MIYESVQHFKKKGCVCCGSQYFIFKIKLFKQKCNQTFSKTAAICLYIIWFCFNMKTYKKMLSMMLRKNVKVCFLVLSDSTQNRFETIEDLF